MNREMGLTVTITVTAESTIKLPMMFLNVSASLNTRTPQTNAVTGSKAPRMDVGVEPIKCIEAVMVINEMTVGNKASPMAFIHIKGDVSGCKSVRQFNLIK